MNKFILNPFTSNLDIVSEVTLGSFGSSPNANGASISSSQVLTLQPADATRPGGVSITSQTFSGVKTFSSATLFASGTAAAPGIGWAADADGSGTGFFRGAADEINISNAGTDTWRFARTTGPVLQGKNASAESVFFIQSQSNGALNVSGSRGS